MYHYLLLDTRLYNSLFALDLLIAEQTKQSKCLFCGGVLHQSHFPRKPRGIPAAGLHCDYPIRFSYCCSQEGCRKRLTPPSMRFLSRKVYSSVIIFLIFLFKASTDESKVDELNKFFNTTLSVETLRRWRDFWKNTVPQSHTFKRQGFNCFIAPNLPSSLLSLFAGPLSQQLEMSLRWILPLTRGVNLFDTPFMMKGT